MGKVILAFRGSSTPAWLSQIASSNRLASGLLLAIVILWPGISEAEVTWYFNWYCAGCSKIGARTTGTEGPFSSQSGCESARSRMRSSMSAVGGGVDAMPCYSRGIEPSPPSSSPHDSGSRDSRSYSPPTYDFAREEAERRRRQEEQERQEREEAEKKRQQQEQFIRERDKAAASLKGGGTRTFGIKGTPEGDLQIKSATPSKERREISTAWKQIYCAASISLSAIDAARKDPPDIEEVRYLGEEAVKALSGDRMGVACPDKIPAPPESYEKEKLDNSALLKFYSSLMQAAATQAQQIVDLNRQISDLKSQLQERSTRFEQMQRPVSVAVVDLGNAKSNVVDISVVRGNTLFRARSDKPGIDRIVVPLPPIPADPESSSWLRLAARLQYFPGMEGLRDRYVKGYTTLQELRNNLAADALRAQSSVAGKPIPLAQARLDAWLEEEVDKARDRIVREEEQAIARLRGQSFDKMVKEFERYQKQQTARDQHVQEATKATAKNIEEILTQEESAIQAVRGESGKQMLKEMMRLKEQGLYKEGDNLVEKERTDARYRQAVNQAADSILKEEEAKITALRRQTQASVGKELEHLNEQGFDLLAAGIEDNTTLDAARDRIFREEEKAIQAVRARSLEKLTKEVENLQKQKAQKIKEEQAALSETEKQLASRQTEKQQAAAKLGQYRSFAQKAANDPVQAQILTKQIK